MTAVRSSKRLLTVALSIVVAVTNRGDSYGCETSRLPQFPENRITDGGEVVSLTRRPPFTQEDS
jgi:hypothetical protein